MPDDRNGRLMTVPEVAVRVCGPPAVAPAVNRPVELTEPPPETAHVTAGCGVMASPN